MQLVKVRKQKESIKVKLTKKEKTLFTIIKNVSSLMLLIGGVICMFKSALVLLTYDPNMNIHAVPIMVKYIIVGMAMIFSFPFVKYIISVK